MAEVNSNHIPEPAANVAQTQGAQDVHMTDASALVNQLEATNEGHSTPVPVADIGDVQFDPRFFNTTTQPSQVQQGLPLPQPDNQQVPPQSNGQQLPLTTSQQDQQSQSTPTKPTSTPTHLAPAPSNSQPTQMARGTPTRETGSRAASAHPEPATKMPTEAAPHGAPVRQYINSQVTPVLLEGMRKLAVQRPKDPLRFLGEFILQRSKEIEGTGTGAGGNTNGGP